MTDVIQATKRDSTGTSSTIRLRREGNVPAVLYGHGEANEHLAIPATQVKGLLRTHSKMVKLTGDVNETALISEMQWDALGIEVLHLDLIRVNIQEKIELTVSIHTHGEAIGTREGGILLENVREVEIRCSAGSIPENLALDVNGLHLGQNATAADLQLPEGVELITPADTVIAHIEEPRQEMATNDTADSVGAEPEVIAKGGGEDAGEA